MDTAYPLTFAWLKTCNWLMSMGSVVAPRGKVTRELLHQTTMVDMRRPVLMIPERKLNYRFMAAEAHWILSGDNTVAGIAPWNKNIAQFSDDGEKFFGAYGPPLMDQIDYVIQALLKDPVTRQAVLTLWRPNPPATKDVPCTVAMTFNIRHGKLNAHVFMRSSDVWLGLPYDLFNFAMIAHYICARVNVAANMELGSEDYNDLEPGALFLTAASSHVYEPHFEGLRKILEGRHDIYGNAVMGDQGAPTPVELYTQPHMMATTLLAIRDGAKDDVARWWQPKVFTAVD